MQIFTSSGEEAGVGDSGATDSVMTGARFLQVQTLGSILRNSFAIYAHNWRAITLIYAMPLLPIVLLQLVLTDAGMVGLAAIAQLLRIVVGVFIGAVVTVLISDLCLGFQPSVGRSYRRAFANGGRLVGTYLMGFLVIIGGMILLVVPGVVFAFWYMFVLPVVVLEQLGGSAALRRSRGLGKGCYLRNWGILLLIVVPAWLLTAILALLLKLGAAGLADLMPIDFAALCDLLSIVAVAPFVSIPGILLYYDMRARKDGYGLTQLAEEMRI